MALERLPSVVGTLEDGLLRVPGAFHLVRFDFAISIALSPEPRAVLLLVAAQVGFAIDVLEYRGPTYGLSMGLTFDALGKR